MTSGGIFLISQGDVVGFARFVVDSRTNKPSETIHGHRLDKFAKPRQQLVAIYYVRIFSEFEQMSYSYYFKSIDGIPMFLGDMNKGGKMFQNVVAWDINNTVDTSYSFCLLSTDPKKYSVKTIDEIRDKLLRRPSRLRFHGDPRSTESDLKHFVRVPKPTIDFVDLTGSSDEESNDGPLGDENFKVDAFEESVDQFDLEMMAEEEEEARNQTSQEPQNVACPDDTSDEDASPSLRASKLQNTEYHCLSPAERIILRLNKRKRRSSQSPHAKSNKRSGNCFQSMSMSSSDTTNGESSSNHFSPSDIETQLPEPGSSTRTNQASQGGYANFPAVSQDFDTGDEYAAGTLFRQPIASERRGIYQTLSSASSTPSVSLPGGCLQVLAPRMSLPKIWKRAYRFKERKPAGNVSVGVRKRSTLELASRSLQINPFQEAKFCCKKGCHSMVNVDYAGAQYRRFLLMDRADRKHALKLMLNRDMNLFWFDGQPVCSRFMVTLSFSNQLQSAVKGTTKARASSSIMACTREVKVATKKDHVMLYLKDVAGTLGDALPTKSQFNLPLLSKKHVFERFLKSVVAKPDREHVSYSYFCDVWKKHCSEFKTHRNHGSTVCAICEKLRAKLATCESSALEDALRAQMDAHYKLMAAERRGYAERIDLTKKFPGKYISFIVDGADQKGYGLPHFVFNTKDDKGQKMKVKCVGVLEHGLEKHLSLFAMTEEFESGANHVLEAIHRVLQKKEPAVGTLPEVLFIQADNCTRENKNKYFMGYCEMLVANGVFLQVQVSFLPIEHTHTDIDQGFSAVANRLRMFDAITMSDLINELANCYNPSAEAEVMEKVANFSGLCDVSRCLRKIRGMSQYRFFRFLRRSMSADAEKEATHRNIYATTCDVKVQLFDEWSPLDDSFQRMGFLRDVPNLRDTPSTDTSPPENVLEVKKHLESVEDRIGSEENMQSLLKLKEKVYVRRVEAFHWDLTSCFELQGDYIGITTSGGRRNPVTSEDHIVVENLSYPLNAFIAVRTETGCNDPFWLARTLEIAKKDMQGNTLKLKVRWYEAKLGAKDAFSAKYKMATFMRGSHQEFFDDQVDVRSILCQFESLTQSGSLHIRTQKAIRQCLNMN